MQKRFANESFSNNSSAIQENKRKKLYLLNNSSGFISELHKFYHPSTAGKYLIYLSHN